MRLVVSVLLHPGVEPLSFHHFATANIQMRQFRYTPNASLDNVQRMRFRATKDDRDFFDCQAVRCILQLCLQPVRRETGALWPLKFTVMANTAWWKWVRTPCSALWGRY